MIAVVPGPSARRLLGLAVVVLGLLGLGGPAEASGCHVSERPTFGLTGPSEWDLSSDFTSPDPLAVRPFDFRRSPCPGDAAGLGSKVELPRACCPVAGRFVEKPALGDRPYELPGVHLPVAGPNPLDRPPRPFIRPSSR